MIDDIYFKVNEKMQSDENARQIIDNYINFEISSVDDAYNHFLDLVAAVQPFKDKKDKFKINDMFLNFIYEELKNIVPQLFLNESRCCIEEVYKLYACYADSLYVYQICSDYSPYLSFESKIKKYKHALISRDFELAHLLFKKISSDNNCTDDVFKDISNSYPQIIEAWSILNKDTFKQNVISDIKDIEDIHLYGVDVYNVIDYMIDINSDLSHILCLTFFQNLGFEQKIKILDRYSFKDIVNEFNKRQIDLYQDVYDKPLIFYLNPLMVHGLEWNNIKNITYLNKTYQETIIDNIKANPLKYTNDMEKIYHIFNDLNKKNEVMDLFKSMIKDKNFLLSDLSSNDITSEYIGYNAMDKEKDNITSLSELNKKARSLLHLGDFVSAYLLKNESYIAPNLKEIYNQKKEVFKTMNNMFDSLDPVWIINHFNINNDLDIRDDIELDLDI